LIQDKTIEVSPNPKARDVKIPQESDTTTNIMRNITLSVNIVRIRSVRLVASIIR